MLGGETAAEDAVAFADVIDSLSAGVFLIGADGAIAHANAQARTMLASTDMLRVVHGRLVAADPVVNRALRAALLAAVEGGVVGSAALPLTSPDGTRHVVRVRPLRASVKCAAAVFVDRATFEAPSCPDVIGRAYRLTPAELRVLFAVVDFGGAPDVAAALGIAISTVKTHLARLFEKTGTRRQADLVKLVAAFSDRLVADPRAVQAPDTFRRPSERCSIPHLALIRGQPVGFRPAGESNGRPAPMAAVR